MQGERFIQKKYNNIHTTPEVESAKRRTEKRTGEKVSQKPVEKISNYLARFDEILNREDDLEKERGVMALKHILHRNNVIKEEEIPEVYFNYQQQLAREQGHGDIEITKEIRGQLTEVIISDQESSLDKWIDYLSSNDALYPTWAKYWALRSVLGMSTYDKEKQAFGKRDKGTTAPFPDINREALAYVVDATIKHQSGDIDTNTEEDFKKLIQGANFAKLYAHAIEKITPASQESIENTEGEWVVYPKDSDHMPLVQTLQGHGTGWCTAGENTAEIQLKGGDFHIYYTYDTNGKLTVPRVAIRMQESSIAEIRGIAADQNLDPYIGDVVQNKLKEFPDGKSYEKKTEDMNQLTVLEQCTQEGKDMTKEDLHFLYEINSKIEGFGYERDPRIDELLRDRNIKEDLSFVFGISKDKISTTKDEALSGDIAYHHGILYLGNLTTTEGLSLPESISGYLNLDRLTTTEGLSLPESIGGALNLNSLTTIEGLSLPKNIGGNLYLNSLTTIEGLSLPKNIGGNLYFDSLTTAEINILKEKYPQHKIL